VEVYGIEGGSWSEAERGSSAAQREEAAQPFAKRAE